MPPTITITSQDPCPACAGTLVKAPQATPAQRAKALDRFDPAPLPPHFDTASPEQIAEHGELWRCATCDYPHREHPGDPAADDAGDAAPARAKKTPAKAALPPKE